MARIPPTPGALGALGIRPPAGGTARDLPAQLQEELTLWDALWQAEEATDEPRRLRARNRLAELHRDLVPFARRRLIFSGTREQEEDLVAWGTHALLISIDRYDPRRGVQFSTYAVPKIAGAMRHWLRDQEGRGRHPLKRIETTSLSDYLDEHGSVPAECPDPEEEAMLLDDRRALGRAFRSLDPPVREAIYMVVGLEWTQQQAADQLHVNQMTIHRWLRLAGEQLGASLVQKRRKNGPRKPKPAVEQGLDGGEPDGEEIR